MVPALNFKRENSANDGVRRTAQQYSVWHTSPVPKQIDKPPRKTAQHGSEPSIPDESGGREVVAGRLVPQKEIGGPAGPDPIRFGDWEKGGRCIDF
jgi:hypothetical protein